jgi:ligand-binding sensor domain-containing protein
LVTFHGAILARIGPLLSATILIGCAADRGAEGRPADPSLLPFTYAPRSDGAANGGVRAILQDRHGHYWFGSHFEGVCRVDREQVRKFTTADGLSDDQVRAIEEAPDGSIWFDTGVGVSSFDGERIWTRTDRELPVMSPWALEPGDLWFKADESHGFSTVEREAGVYRLNDGRLTYLALPLPPQLRPDSGYSVTGFAKGKGGRIWIATYNAVFGFDGVSFTTIDGTRMGLREGEGVPHVRCVFEDSRGRVWIGNNGVGVIVVDGDSTVGLTPLAGTSEVLLRMGDPLTPSAAVDRDRSLQRVFSIGEDRDGNIWIGTIGGGAWRYDGRELRQFTASDGLTTASVMAIYCGRDGTLWLGGEGVFRLTGQRFERVH